MTNVLLYTLGVVVFAVAIAASIGLHELGHLVPAKKFGVKVTQYFVGFGRTLWSRRRGETEYGLKAIPLGGYVKIIGMLPPAESEHDGRVDLDKDGNEVRRLRKSNTGLFTQLISDARAAEWELIEKGDDNRLFYQLPWWKKVIIMSGGPLVNLVIAFVLFAIVFGFYGDPANPKITTRVDTVSDCVIPATEDRLCTDADPASPAKQAGLRQGDVVTSFNGTEIDSWAELQPLIRENSDGEATIGVVRDGDPLTVTTNTTVEARPALDGANETLTEVGFLGVTPTLVFERHGLIYTAGQMGTYTVQTVEALGQLPVKLWGVARAVVGVEERDPESPMSVVGASRVAGEVTSEETISVSEKTVGLLMLIAGLNLFVGMFNFIPLLPLDGGHIAGALYDALRRGAARLLHRPDPGHFDTAKLLPVAYVMAGVLLLMSLVLIVGDIVAPVRLG